VRSQIVKANGEPVNVDYMMRRKRRHLAGSPTSISTLRSAKWRPADPNLPRSWIAEI
jgi:hypothetical protein